MGQIGSDTRRIHDIVQGQVRDQIRLLQEQGQRLADSTGSTANDDCENEKQCERVRVREGERVVSTYQRLMKKKIGHMN